MKKLLIVLVAAGLVAACSTEPKEKATAATAVIFDTDIGNDIDDVLALQMLFNYEKAGRIDLLGITLSKSNPNTVPFLDAYCRLNDRGDMPIGYAYNGANPEEGGYLVQTLTAKKTDGTPVLEPKRQLGEDIPEGYVLLRQLLAAQPDHSVTLIAVGPLTNIARLLQSPGDAASPLTGRELVAQKAEKLCIMSGLYTDEFNFPEWNVVQDLSASQIVYNECPVPLVTSGWEVGNKLLYPHQSVLADFGDPACHALPVAYAFYQQMPYDRQTWDLTTVLEAIDPQKAYFEYSPAGMVVIESDGKSVFTPSEQGLHRYLTIPDAQLDRTLKAIVGRTTGKDMEN